MTTLEELTIIREQYRFIRKTAISDFRNSSYLVPFTTDASSTTFQELYSKGFVGHTGPSGTIIGPNPSLYSLFLEGIEENEQSKVNIVGAQCPRLVDPYCLFDNEVYGRYKSSYSIPPAYHITSPEAGAELVEVYCMSLMRDTCFYLFDDVFGFTGGTGTAGSTAENYFNKIIGYMNQSNIKNYLNAPLDGGNITRKVLFRGDTQGDLIGPYLSQFNYYRVAYGQLLVDQKYVSFNLNPMPISNVTTFWNLYGNPPYTYACDFIKDVSGFVTLWNGGNVIPDYSPFDIISDYRSEPRVLTTLRDAALYIYRDQIWQPFFTAATILLSQTRVSGGIGVPVGFKFIPRFAGKFIDLGPVELFNLLSLTCKLSMDATWLWKWRQLRVRPEEMAYQVHLKKKTIYGLDICSNVLNNNVLVDVSNNNNGNYLLPLAYTIGSPCHPSYPSGHATIAGAMSTVLKAWFNCDSSMNAVVSIPSPTAVDPPVIPLGFLGFADYESYGGVSPLRIDHELDKMASNCSIMRNFAGIHYRSDAYAGLQIGEDVAIAVLTDWVKKYSNDIIFRFRKRNSQVYEISKTYSGPVSISGNIYFTTPVRLESTPVQVLPPLTSGPGEIFEDPNLS
jgi:membrane-associated phospholipid phosphatase